VQAAFPVRNHRPKAVWLKTGKFLTLQTLVPFNKIKLGVNHVTPVAPQTQAVFSNDGNQ